MLAKSTSALKSIAPHAKIIPEYDSRLMILRSSDNNWLCAYFFGCTPNFRFGGALNLDWGRNCTHCTPLATGLRDCSRVVKQAMASKVTRYFCILHVFPLKIRIISVEWLKKFNFLWYMIHPPYSLYKMSPPYFFRSLFPKRGNLNSRTQVTDMIKWIRLIGWEFWDPSLMVSGEWSG